MNADGNQGGPPPLRKAVPGAGPRAVPPPPPLPSGSPPSRGGPPRVYLVAGVAVGAVVLVAVVAGLLRAMGGREQAPASAVLPAPAPGGTPAGLTDSEVVFGMASPFSGANKELGRGMKAGLELAFAAANEAGGVHGRTLRLLALDDEYEPDRTAAVMKELVEKHKVFAIAGNVGSSTAAVSVPYAMGRKIPFIGALSGSPILRKDPPDRYVFNFRPSYAEETAAAVRYLVEVRGHDPSRVAVFSQEDEFGDACFEGAAAQLARYGRAREQIVKTGYKRNSADVDAAVAALRGAPGEVQAVVMGATTRAAARFIVKVRDAGLAPTFTNVSPVDATHLAEELLGAGRGYTEDVVVTQVVPLPTSNASAVMRYRQLLEKHMIGEQPGFLSLEGYVVGQVIVEALRRAGRGLDGEKLVAALEGIQGLDLGIGAIVGFGPAEHQGSHKVWGTMLQPDGSYRQMDLQ